MLGLAVIKQFPELSAENHWYPNATAVALEGVQVVDQECSVCRWKTQPPIFVDRSCKRLIRLRCSMLYYAILEEHTCRRARTNAG